MTPGIEDLDPNLTAFPSLLVNSPMQMPGLLKGTGDMLDVNGQLDVVQVTEMAGIQQIGEPPIMPQGAINDLMELRARFPFVPILPLFGQVAAVFLPTANLADDLIFPPGTTLVSFRGNNDYYVSLHGNAEVPSAVTNPATKTGGSQASRSFFKPEGNVWYARQLKSVSCVAPNANTIVTALCYITNQWPGGRERGNR